MRKNEKKDWKKMREEEEVRKEDGDGNERKKN